MLPKKLWNFFNSKRKSNRFPSSLSYGDVVSYNTQNTCDLFASLFQKVYEKYATSTYPDLTSHPIKNINTFNISVDDVQLAISARNPSFKIDCEGVSPQFFKTCSDTIAYPLTLLFNKCLVNGTFIDSGRFVQLNLSINQGTVMMLATIGLSSNKVP